MNRLSTPSRPTQRAPLAVYILLAAIITCYVFPPALYPALDLGNRSSLVFGGEMWRLFTSLFVHANPVHLALSCISLLIFGLRVERKLGRWSSVALFCLSGVLGSLVSAIFGRSSVSVGASGGVFGLIAANAVYHYRLRNRLGESGRRELVYTGATVLINVAYGLLEPSVDNWAHLGGLAAGWGMSWWMIARALRTGKLFPSERLPGRDQRLLSMRIGSALLSAGFVLGFRELLHQFTLLRYLTTTDSLTLFQSSLIPVLQFVAALELWHGNQQVNWILLPLITFETSLALARLATGFVDIDDVNVTWPTMLLQESHVLLYVSLVILLTGRPGRPVRAISIGVFIAYCLTQGWLLFASG